MSYRLKPVGSESTKRAAASGLSKRFLLFRCFSAKYTARPGRAGLRLCLAAPSSRSCATLDALLLYRQLPQKVALRLFQVGMILLVLQLSASVSFWFGGSLASFRDRYRSRYLQNRPR